MIFRKKVRINVLNQTISVHKHVYENEFSRYYEFIQIIHQFVKLSLTGGYRDKTDSTRGCQVCILKPVQLLLNYSPITSKTSPVAFQSKLANKIAPKSYMVGWGQKLLGRGGLLQPAD